MRDPIYLDFNATTPVHPSVLDAMFRSLVRDSGIPRASCGSESNDLYCKGLAFLRPAGSAESHHHLCGGTSRGDQHGRRGRLHCSYDAARSMPMGPR